MTPAHAILYRFFEIHFNTIIPSMPRSSKVVSLLQFSPPKPCKQFFPTSHAPHAPPIPYTLTWSPAYFVNSTNHAALRYAAVSTFLLLHLLRTNIFISAVFSSTLNLCFTINVRHPSFKLIQYKTQKFSFHVVCKKCINFMQNLFSFRSGNAPREVTSPTFLQQNKFFFSASKENMSTRGLNPNCRSFKSYYILPR